jgi:prolyl-tRNA synthetase
LGLIWLRASPSIEQAPATARRTGRHEDASPQTCDGKETNQAAETVRAPACVERERVTMRLSKHFGRTLRKAPSNVTTLSQQLALRAGIVRPSEDGGWAYLPLGARIMRRLEDAFADTLLPFDGEEIRLPPSAEPVDLSVARLGAQEVESYRDLPRVLYTLQRRPSDGSQPLLHADPQTSAHVVSLHSDPEDQAAFYQQLVKAVTRTLAGLGLEAAPVSSAYPHGRAGEAHAFMLPHPAGRSGFVSCRSCGYAASLESAAFERREARYGEPASLEKVETPDCHTIANLCAFLDIDQEQTLKLVIYITNFNQPDEALVMALVRGDLDVSEAKLRQALGVEEIAPATEDLIAGAGAVAGYASPIGLQVRQSAADEGVWVVADESLQKMSNFVTGANQAGYHFANANYPRDFAVTQFADIAQPPEGARCPDCGSGLQVSPAVELGKASRRGADFSGRASATFQDAAGKEQPLVVSHCETYLDRLLAALIETHHDDYGILWPQLAAPFDVHLVAVARQPEDEAAKTADQIYHDLLAAGLSVVYDDRLQSPGVMFNDADLFGVPLRVTVGARSLEQGGVEVKWRYEKERSTLPLDGLPGAIVSLVNGKPQNP